MNACNKLARFIIACHCPDRAPAVLVIVGNDKSKDQVTYAHNWYLSSSRIVRARLEPSEIQLFLILGLESDGAASQETNTDVVAIASRYPIVKSHLAHRFPCGILSS